MNSLRFSVMQRDHGCRVECALIAGDSTTGYAFALPIQIKTLEEGELIGPAMTLSPDEAAVLFQSMMDQLWKLGIRPADIGTPGHLAATQKHLDDMRAIVGKQLGIDL